MVSFDHLSHGFSLAPIVKMLGMELTEAKDGKATVRLPFQEGFQQGLGVLHGGVLTLLGDSACWFATASKRDDVLPTTVELKINFLKPAKQTDLTAQAEVVKSGRRITTARFEVFSGDGDLCAIGLSTLVTAAVEHEGIPLEDHKKEASSREP